MGQISSAALYYLGAKLSGGFIPSMDMRRQLEQ